MLETGIVGQRALTVTEALTAQAMGSGLLPVLATPALIALAEKTAWQSVEPYLEPGQGTVGTLVNMRHLAATTVGGVVTCETKLMEIDRRRLVFSVIVRDKTGTVGEGIHERFIVDNERFMKKAAERQ